MSQPTVRCPSCGTMLRDAANFCPSCKEPRTHVRQRLEQIASESGLPYEIVLEYVRSEALRPRTTEERSAVLDAVIADAGRHGFQLVNRSPFSATLVRPKKWNYGKMAAFLLIGRIGVSYQKETALTLTVDERGEVDAQVMDGSKPVSGMAPISPHAEKRWQYTGTPLDFGRTDSRSSTIDRRYRGD